MPAPVLDVTRLSLEIPLGQALGLTIPATNFPSLWIGASLPPGITLSDTGRLSGIPTEGARFDTRIEASNADGSATAYLDILVIEPVPVPAGMGVRVNFDLDTGEVTRPGQKEGEPVLFWGRTGDRLHVLITFLRDGVPQEIAPSTIRIAVKEFEGEIRRYDLVADPSDIQPFGARYQVRAVFTAAALRTLAGDYEGDVSTGFNATAEIQFQTPEFIASAAAPVSTTESLAPEIPGDYPLGDTDSVVASLPVTEPGWYSLPLADSAHSLTAIYDLLLTRSGGGRALASFTYRAEGSSPIGTVSGIQVKIATDGTAGPPWVTGNLWATGRPSSGRHQDNISRTRASTTAPGPHSRCLRVDSLQGATLRLLFKAYFVAASGLSSHPSVNWRKLDLVK